MFHLFKRNDNNLTGFDNGPFIKAVKRFKKTGDFADLNKIKTLIGTKLFVTYFKIPDGLTKKELKKEIGKPIYHNENGKLIPIFTSTFSLLQYKPEYPTWSYKMTELYINYIIDQLSTEEYGDCNGIIINPGVKDKELIISRKTLLELYEYSPTFDEDIKESKKTII